MPCRLTHPIRCCPRGDYGKDFSAVRKEIENNNFREDLLHRLSVIPLKVPSLKERKTDIPLLINHFIKLICSQHGVTTKEIEPSAIQALSEYTWPGNIRELRNVIERLIILSDKKITAEDVKTHQ